MITRWCRVLPNPLQELAKFAIFCKDLADSRELPVPVIDRLSEMFGRNLWVRRSCSALSHYFCHIFMVASRRKVCTLLLLQEAVIVFRDCGGCSTTPVFLYLNIAWSSKARYARQALIINKTNANAN